MNHRLEIQAVEDETLQREVLESATSDTPDPTLPQRPRTINSFCTLYKCSLILYDADSLKSKILIITSAFLLQIVTMQLIYYNTFYPHFSAF